MSSQLDDLQKLAELRDRGAITIEEFDWQKSKILYGDPKKELAAASVSEKSRLVAFLLCFFLGVIGVHRFYVGKTGTGIAQIFTLGGLGLWAFIDMIVILCGSFKDKEGKVLKNWNDI
jgi:TM2 domain-containing membrane protein YozV